MMSDHRGRGARGRGGSHHSTRAGTGTRPAFTASRDDKPRREAILDLGKFIDKEIRVKFTGGREVTGTLKGYDQLLNLVMDNLEEVIRDPVSGLALDPRRTRSLGLAVIRGTSLVALSPIDGSGEIENPFASV